MGLEVALEVLIGVQLSYLGRPIQLSYCGWWILDSVRLKYAMTDLTTGEVVQGRELSYRERERCREPRGI